MTDRTPTHLVLYGRACLVLPIRDPDALPALITRMAVLGFTDAWQFDIEPDEYVIYETIHAGGDVCAMPGCLGRVWPEEAP